MLNISLKISFKNMVPFSALLPWVLRFLLSHGTPLEKVCWNTRIQNKIIKLLRNPKYLYSRADACFNRVFNNDCTCTTLLIQNFCKKHQKSASSVQLVEVVPISTSWYTYGSFWWMDCFNSQPWNEIFTFVDSGLCHKGRCVSSNLSFAIILL